MELELSIIVLLVISSFFAGVVDSIAGGGGLITLPALLAAGIPPAEALGTNKLQSSFGSFSATHYFWQKGYISLKESRITILLVFVASAFGSILVQFTNTGFLERAIPYMLIGFSLYFLFSPKVSDAPKNAITSPFIVMILAGAVGFYDGFFGPGTGSFFVLIFVMLAGVGITHATAKAKLLNFTSNIASLIFFTLGDSVLWSVGLAMAAGQFMGARVGSRLALKHGIRIIKPLLVAMSLAISLKLLLTQ